MKDSKEGVEVSYSDWVFINYTFKRFDHGLTQRGPIPKNK